MRNASRLRKAFLSLPPNTFPRVYPGPEVFYQREACDPSEQLRMDLFAAVFDDHFGADDDLSSMTWHNVRPLITGVQEDGSLVITVAAAAVRYRS